MPLTKRIFLIDDDVMLNVVHHQLLRDAGFKGRVTTFENAQDALDEIDKMITNDHDDMPRIIFLDIQMPGINGWEFLHEFENLTLSLPEPCKVYMLRSSISPINIARAQSYQSVQSLLQKPMSTDKLEELFKFE